MKTLTLTYTGKVKTKLYKIPPKSPNLCRLSVFANALNLLGYKRLNGYYMTSERLLSYLNKSRVARDEAPLNPDKSLIPVPELVNYVEKTGLGGVKILYGKKSVNIDLWKKLILNKFPLSSDHQELYFPPRSNEITFDYLPPKLFARLRKKVNSTHSDFIEFYKNILKIHGPSDECHIDLVVDLIKIKGEDHVVLANLNSVNNKTFIKIPWNIFANYLTFGWERWRILRKTGELPRKTQFAKLKKEGTLNDPVFKFTFGETYIFYKKRKEKVLNEILNSFDVK